MTPTRRPSPPLLALLLLLQQARAPLKLTSKFGHGREFPVDNRGDEDNVSPPLSWSGAPKSTESFVLIVESDVGSDKSSSQRKTHWVVYDIPKEVNEMREELSGDGSSDVRRLGMKDDVGTPPVVVDPMGAIDGWVDPEIKAMQDTIHSAIDASFEDRNRAKEGAGARAMFGRRARSPPAARAPVTRHGRPAADLPGSPLSPQVRPRLAAPTTRARPSPAPPAPSSCTHSAPDSRSRRARRARRCRRR